MPSFKFSQIETATKVFHKQMQVTEIFMIDVKTLLSNRIPFDNEKDWWCIVGFKVDGEKIILLFIKTPKNVFSYGSS